LLEELTAEAVYLLLRVKIQEAEEEAYRLSSGFRAQGWVSYEYSSFARGLQVFLLTIAQSQKLRDLLEQGFQRFQLLCNLEVGSRD
jgi:hypothetical protein